MTLIDHSGNFQLNFGEKYYFTKIWICSSHIALFFVLSGLCVQDKQISLFRFIDKKIKRLIVPYVLWCLIYSGSLRTNTFLGMIYGTNQSLCHVGINGVFWFLPVMFISQILFFLLQKLLNKLNKNLKRSYIFISLILFLVSILLNSLVNTDFFGKLWISDIVRDYGFLFGADIAIMGTVLMIFGYLLKDVFETIIKFSRKWVLFISMLCIILGFVMSQFNTPNSGWTVVVMARGLYGEKIILFLITAMLSAMGIIILSMLFSESKYLSYLGEQSMLIYGLHMMIFPYIIRICECLMKEYKCFFLKIDGLLLSLCSATLCVIICIPLIWIIKKYFCNLDGRSL